MNVNNSSANMDKLAMALLAKMGISDEDASGFGSSLLNSKTGSQGSSQVTPRTAVGAGQGVVSSSADDNGNAPDPVDLDLTMSLQLYNQQNSNGETELPDDQSELKALLEKYKEDRDAEALKNNESSGRRKGFRRDLVAPEIVEWTKSLPIYSKKDELLKLIKNHQIVVIVGETGSGKSTQIPQYLADAGMIKEGLKIGITQPRRVAAKSLATRVAEECGVKLGTLVGYAVRFDSCVSSQTIIKYLTDGLLVKDCTMTMEESNFDSYSIIMVDEAHERSIHTDVCFGLLKRAAKKRPDLKIIISSATLEQQKFSAFFDNAPVFSITGKSYNVDIIYEPPPPGSDYVQNVLNKIFQIHLQDRKVSGDILVFLTGQEDIETIWEAAEIVISTRGFKIELVPCYGTLPFEDQQRIFQDAPKGYRKVVLSTNIAETSITIDGIAFVIDCGRVKEKRFNAQTRIESLIKVPITKFHAIQRQGRAGRTQDGKCFRLYSQASYEQFTEAQVPDIKRSDVDSVVLDLMAMGITNPTTFDFVDSPPMDAIMEALNSLKGLGALNENLMLTSMGRQMAVFPLDPPLAKVLITSTSLGCSTAVIKIVALLSTQYQRLFHRDKKTRELADQKKLRFHQVEGDHLTLLKIYDEWTTFNYSEEWCKQNLIQYRCLMEAKEIVVQLKGIMKKNKLLNPKGLDFTPCHPSQQSEKIRKAFTSGYFLQLGKKQPKGYAYQKLCASGDKKDIFLHPSSCLFKLKPEWILFHEAMETNRPYASGVIEIRPEWVREFAPDFASEIAKKYKIPI